MVEIVGEGQQRVTQRLVLGAGGEAIDGTGDVSGGDLGARRDGVLQPVRCSEGVAELLGPRGDRFEPGDLPVVTTLGSRPTRQREPDDTCDDGANHPAGDHSDADDESNGKGEAQDEPIGGNRQLVTTGGQPEHRPAAQTGNHDEQAESEQGTDRHHKEAVHQSHHPPGDSSNEPSKPCCSSRFIVVSRMG